MKHKRFFYVLVLLQVITLIGVASSYYVTRTYGEKIILKTEPIDPKDLLHGEYVLLNYDISALSTALWEGKTKAKHNDMVYVVLKQDGLYHIAVGITPRKPKLMEGELAIKGIVRGTWNLQSEILINYGIERFYVEEGMGQIIEEKGPEGVAIRVAPWGQMTIEKINP